MNEREPKIIKVPDSVWKDGQLEKDTNYEAFGSLDFSFLKVPYDFDGDAGDLYDDEGAEKEGIENMEPIDIDMVPSPLGLSLNGQGVGNVDGETGGAFLRFLGGGDGQRYILLDRHKQELEDLRKSLPRIQDEFRKKFVEVLIRNADAALEKYGNKAALFIS